MKKKVGFFLLGAFPILSHAQFSNKNEKITPTKDTIANIVDLKLHLSSDTTKARIIYFAKGESDQFLGWMDGYLVVKTYKLPNGQVTSTVGSLAYTQKWQLIRPEDVFDVKVMEQKK
jgi:hypothetical protein